jgi:quinol-cytochrome oxidoreductase complex cytochrome b subunit
MWLFSVVIIIIIIIIIIILKFRRLHLFERNGFNAGTHQMGQVKSIPVWLELWYHNSVAATQQHKEGQGRTRAD